MEKYIKRDRYIAKLAARRNNGDIKIVTGPRRSGKSWLLMRIYRDFLLSQGVPPGNIIAISLDTDEDPNGLDFTDPITLKKYVYSRIADNGEYYVFLDEVQMLEGFERIVNGLNARDNVDVYISGSNSRFLSSDINTILRGRGDEIRVYPLSFSEFCSDRDEPVSTLWKEYYTYGGMPALRNHPSAEQKVAYLQRLWQKTYIDDVVERHGVKNRQALEVIVDALCSSIGSLTNPNKIKNTLRTVQGLTVDNDTIASYMRHLEDAFLFEGSRRYNIKGKRYYESIKKYYVVDVGLRNARLNYRQQEETHIMENVIYNELRLRGYAVDVGVIEERRMSGSKSEYRQLEVDFIATNGTEKYYIQSAYAIGDDTKRQQETASLRKIDDSFRKIIVVRDDIQSYHDDNGYLIIGLFDFLLSSSL